MTGGKAAELEVRERARQEKKEAERRSRLALQQAGSSLLASLVPKYPALLAVLVQKYLTCRGAVARSRPRAPRRARGQPARRCVCVCVCECVCVCVRECVGGEVHSILKDVTREAVGQAHI